MRTPRLIAGVTLATALSLAPEAAAQDLPASEAAVESRLLESPRHGEWVKYEAGAGDSVTAWLVFPERSDNAPVVVVIHEIFGLTDWVRGVVDQLAAEGFIAIAPDLLSGKGPAGGGTESIGASEVRRYIRDLDRGEIYRRLDGAAQYGTALPAARPQYAVIGFCWGGSTSFAYATHQGDLAAAVVYYGSAPTDDVLAGIVAPVLGLYGGDDARVNATIPAAIEEMGRLDSSYEPNIYAGAGHGFLRRLDGRSGANLQAAQQAWPTTIRFLREAF